MRAREVPRVWRVSREASEAEESGRNAARMQLSRDCNPFDYDTDRTLYARWDKGWRSYAVETGLPANLRNLREERDWTQGQLARLIGTSQVAVSHYEQGRREPREKVLKRMADVFGCTVEALTRKTVQ